MSVAVAAAGAGGTTSATVPLATTAKAALLGRGGSGAPASVGIIGSRLAAAGSRPAALPESSGSAASSSDHLHPLSSSSPGASYGTAAPMWADDQDTTDDQDGDAGWQTVHSKASGRVAGAQQHYHHGTPPGTTASSSSGGAGPPGGASGKPAVCGRCGMRGHLAARCRQPHCSRCNKFWHTEDECSRACHGCGSLEHRASAAVPCRSYKCRECGLHGHVYAECPNIVCNLCKQVGHKALDCPSIVCNLCKQQGHKAVNCPNPRGVQSAPQQQPAAPISGGQPDASSTRCEVQQLQLAAAAHHVPALLRQSGGSSCGSNASPTTLAAAGSAAAAAVAAAAAGAGDDAASLQPAGVPDPREVPLVLQRHAPPSKTVELQHQQQQHSRLLSQLAKVAPDAAAGLLDHAGRLQALLAVEPYYLAQLIRGLAQQPPPTQQAMLDATLASAQRQLLAHQQQLSSEAAGGDRGAQLLQAQQQQHSSAFAAASSSASVSPAVTPRALAAAVDGSDVTQGIKPGDLAPQHARQLVAEFGDMLPSRWQQLPSWRQLEARLSFPDGNYVQRRLQFRERRRQLQLQTLQLRATAAAAKQAAGRPAAGGGGGGALRATAAKAPVRVVPQVPAGAAPAAAAAAPPPAAAAPCSYAAALAGATRPPAAAAGGGGGGAPASAPADGAAAPATHTVVAGDSSCSHPAPAAVAPQQQLAGLAEPAASDGAADEGGLAVCRRCGMMGHTAACCAQPRCSRCHLWWHSEAQCMSACQFCGSLDHQGDAEQPASCQSFKCKACKMFGHTAAACPHVQLHQQQELARQQQAQAPGAQGCAPSALAAGALPSAAGPSLASSRDSAGSSGMSYHLALQSPAALLTKQGTMGSLRSSSSGQLDSPQLRPPDSPGLGQAGVKPKDLLPEHARALQDEFPNALPPGWQQMASWRMVEERLRVVAVEGAVFSKRRQMWRDRRKHYQALTAAALAAAARSAACDAAAANFAAAAASSDVSSQTAVAAGSPAADADGEAMSRAPQQQQLAVPEWQRQQGSLFGLSGSAASSMGLQLDGQAGSAFSCDTASFCCSPIPAVTPSVLMSPLDGSSGALGPYSGSTTPLHASVVGATSSSAHTTPAMMGGRHAGAGALPGAPGSSAMVSTPQPMPRAAGMGAGVPPGYAAQHAGGGLGPGDMLAPPSGYAPGGGPYQQQQQYGGNAGGSMMPRSPIHYGGQHPATSSPLGSHSTAAAGRGMPAGMLGGGGGGGAYQHMMVAQRQSQLQQQLMLRSPYGLPPASDSPGRHSPMLLSMQQAQQQQHQQQAAMHAQQLAAAARMQRQRRVDQAFLVQQAQAAHQCGQAQAALQGEEAGDNGELDDKLGVLGVLGLQ